ncbi:precorrin-3B synthase [Halotia wernerae UHCC 0503]|nr:precorrin-3B synthase [Halotia wernerae UHCC 0503]
MLSGLTTCPGLFYTTPAQDGILFRLRIPGGILDSQKCRAIADIAQQYGGGYVDVTNRANIQIREIDGNINTAVLKYLQDMGLGSRNPAVDHIRNIMTSPTAGIDPQEVIDTRPFVQSWNDYIEAHPALSGLSAKFSVGFDGGGIVRVSDRLNDIAFVAVVVDGKVYFRLHLSVGAKGKPPVAMGILLSPDQCLPVLAALANVYLNHLDINSRRKPRLREVVNSLGRESYMQEVEKSLPFALFTREDKVRKGQFSGLFLDKSDNQYQHIGIHPQRQKGLFYIGVILPLGRLESRQMKGLADLAQKHGSSSLRLTPWQNLLLTDIPQERLADVQREIAFLGLDSSTSKIKSGLVACSGSRGCAAATTDTKGHALALAKYLETRLTLDCPVNIHFSGCEKSCAQHSKGDITLLGVSNGKMENYHIYVGDGDSNQKFGRELYQYVSFDELPALVEQMIKVYQIKRINSRESFGEFANRHAIAQLKQFFSPNTAFHQSKITANPLV